MYKMLPLILIIILVIIILIIILKFAAIRNYNNEFLRKYKIDKIYSLASEKLAISYDSEVLCIYSTRKKYFDVLAFNEIRQCQLLENNSTIMEGGIGRGLVGGAIAGSTGAIIGAASRKSKNIVDMLSIKLELNSQIDPMIILSLLKYRLKRNSTKYEKTFNMAHEIVSRINNILENKNTIVKSKISNEDKKSNYADELEKLFDLKQKGIIDEEEYKKLKNKIIN